ncbi:MAG: ABC transporter ATP-binding protein [Clostridia bacterium]|nr:ABC transporter ATP-binding protein [Clostridia bacterium]MBQ4612836.1 ABC transporter ATP-binding protein [Clostridia bacterium]
MENAIVVKDLKIRYKSMKAASFKQNFFKFNKSRVDKFEALHGVSFSIKRGDVVGIVGKNGSGKSTMLSAIAGIFSPDEGSIELASDSVGLMSLGVGFQRMMSGRENILISGMLLGFSEAEIRAKMDDIIAFAGLGKFIDMPVKTYSSGMYSKLAFAITTVLEPEILLIDEVLSVGDANFKKKSFAKIKELIADRDRTVLIVSHSLDSLRELCSQILWLHEGNLMKFGPTDEVLKEYEAFMA